MSRVLVRATNWLGDAVMSLPAIRAIRGVFPHAHLAVAARPWVADLYARERAIDRVIVYPAQKGWSARREFAARLRAERFDCAILLQNAFDAALVSWMAGIPERIGYNRDGRRLLLTRAIPVPEPGDIPRHERFYYLELLRRAGMMERLPASEEIRLDGAEEARETGLKRLRDLGIPGPAVGISPGAAYGNAKRWPAERFAEAAGSLGMPCLIFGSAAERALCEEAAAALRRAGRDAWNLAGETTLRDFIDLAAACRVFLTNDSGAMHVASALGVPTVTIFGATDDTTTGPTGPLARVVREHAECSPCLLRECPIDHRCMTRVSSERVSAAALALLEETAWIREPKS
ncbi:MAG TPA: lipopolysaccharide heptosyltransferase II [Verrucomicrobiae bacterium]|nr:lipopolysaccharide heptosyltransferase II [Verrucomicrobiae bacterium]